MSEAADKLARSRLAILESLQRREQRRGRGPVGAAIDGEQWEAAQAAASSSRGGIASGVKEAARSWWRHHPARIALDLATPMLSSYARRKPLQYLGIAAAAGAIFMVIRPWRLISAGGVLMALARSPQLAGVLMAAMSSSNEGGEAGG